MLPQPRTIAVVAVFAGLSTSESPALSMPLRTQAAGSMKIAAASGRLAGSTRAARSTARFPTRMNSLKPPGESRFSLNVEQRVSPSRWQREHSPQATW